MAAGRVRGGYPRVSGLAVLVSGTVLHPWFSGSDTRTVAGLGRILIFPRGSPTEPRNPVRPSWPLAHPTRSAVLAMSTHPHRPPEPAERSADEQGPVPPFQAPTPPDPLVSRAGRPATGAAASPHARSTRSIGHPHPTRSIRRPPPDPLASDRPPPKPTAPPPSLHLAAPPLPLLRPQPLPPVGARGPGEVAAPHVLRRRSP